MRLKLKAMYKVIFSLLHFKIIKNNLGRVEIEGNEEELIEGLFSVLNIHKEEGERVADFEERLWKNVRKILKYDN